MFTEERELTVMLLVDVSASEEFGSRGTPQGASWPPRSRRCSPSRAITNNDRVGLLLFTDRVEKFVPPRKGSKHVLRVVSEILSFQPQGKGTDLALALAWLSRVTKRRTVVFVVSDFLARRLRGPAPDGPAKHDVVPVVLRDPLEEAFPALGLVELEDPETGERAPRRHRGRRWCAVHSRPRMARARAERTRIFRKLELDSVELRAGEDHGEALVRFFRARARRLAA